MACQRLCISMLVFLLILSQDSINSASSVTQTLSREVLEGQRKLMALATSRSNSGTLSTLPIQLNNGPLLHEKVGRELGYLLVFAVPYY